MKVALYMSAWIEIKIHQQLSNYNHVALYMSEWIEIWQTVRKSKFDDCRTLHECVDWNKTANDCIANLSVVALYMSAWIEINRGGLYHEGKPRRTLHECVDWNPKFL